MNKTILSLCFSSLLLADISVGEINLKKDSLCADRALNDSIRDMKNTQRDASRITNTKARENRLYVVNGMRERRELLSK